MHAQKRRKIKIGTLVFSCDEILLVIWKKMWLLTLLNVDR